jgi:hypothetical protein
MTPVAILNTQFVQVALPIVATLFMAAWWNNLGLGAINKRIDDLNRHMEEMRSEMNRRFDCLEALLSPTPSAS